MSQFYARYVPPAPKPIDVQVEEQTSAKRKRSIAVDKPAKKKKRQRTEPETVNGTVLKANGDSNASKEKSPTDELAVDSDTVPEYQASHRDEEAEAAQPKRKEKRKKRRKEGSTSPEAIADDDYSRKHGEVFAKFNKALTEKPLKEDIDEDMADVEPQELHGLEPIPQPEVVDLPLQQPSYSTLAPWQANAVRVVNRQTKAFSDFQIAESTIGNLKKHGIQQSFPIQTTVLPLLLDGPSRHEGDVCVSAATGSGKTLAYVLPMIEDLKVYPSTMLRGLIVVPTRELVQQVRQLCEICGAGTKLKIATASGSKSMKDEQAMLVAEQEIYDPERWERERRAPVDWIKSSLADLLQNAQQRSKPTSTHFVQQVKSKVDVLISTPGRLVDHLKSTPGFNLDHVKWLIVDEADRLLNESYQEWIDVVTPALRSQAATAERDALLKEMRMEAPIREVKKVLLSATMTSDISKLNSLGLTNPKLVILGHPKAQKPQSEDDADVKDLQVDDNGAYHLPPLLEEYVIPIKDGYEKPLYLLELLQQRVLSQTNGGAKHRAQEIQTSDSDSDMSSSDSSSLSDSSSDTDSDSNSSIASSSAAKHTHTPKKTLFHHTSGPNTSKPGTSPSTNSASRVLIFTRSTASAHRLTRLLGLLHPTLGPQITTLTKSTTSSATSRRALASFRSGRASVLIATDRASRGLDIPDLAHVVSYDVPSSALMYVHRVGRTARAGKGGVAWTCVEHREGRWFWGEVGGKEKKGRGAGGGIVREGKVKKVELEVDVEAWKARYEDALGKLGDEVRGKGK